METDESTLRRRPHEFTKLCLKSFSRHRPIPHNLFLLDNHPTDGTREWLVDRKQGLLRALIGCNQGAADREGNPQVGQIFSPLRRILEPQQSPLNIA